MIRNVCELCQEQLDSPETEQRYNYCHKCNEQKHRETDIRQAIGINRRKAKNKMW